MSKNYIKMNKNQNQLSLGNFCRCTKELAQNKAFAIEPLVVNLDKNILPIKIIMKNLQKFSIT